jgi:hypothetical protein
VAGNVRIVTPASPREAAAIMAAVERFLRDHAPPPAAPRRASGWIRAARLEAVGAAGRPPGPAAWGDGHPWGVAAHENHS